MSELKPFIVLYNNNEWGSLFFVATDEYDARVQAKNHFPDIEIDYVHETYSAQEAQDAFKAKQRARQMS